MSAFEFKRPAGPQPWRGEPPRASEAPSLYSGTVARRSLGYLVDVVVIALLGACLGFALSIVGLLSFGLLSPLGIVVLALWPLFYHCFFLARSGATPGMRLFGVELRDWSGGPVAPLQAVLAVVLFYASIAFTAWLILLVALLNERGRTLHDFLANTLVVRR